MAEPRRRFYLDTSAYVALLLDDEAAEDLRADLADGVMLSSTSLALEARRNLIRFAREHGLTPDHYQAATERIGLDVQLFVLRDLTVDLCEAHPIPAVATPRSLDLVHLRTALWFHRQEPIDRFLTKDTAQRDAARELGLPV